MYTRLTEKLITILTDAIQAKEHGLVEDALAFQVEEIATLRQIVIMWQRCEYGYQNKKQHHRDLYVAGTHLQRNKKNILVKCRKMSNKCQRQVN